MKRHLWAAEELGTVSASLPIRRLGIYELWEQVYRTVVNNWDGWDERAEQDRNGRWIYV